MILLLYYWFILYTQVIHKVKNVWHLHHTQIQIKIAHDIPCVNVSRRSLLCGRICVVSTVIKNVNDNRKSLKVCSPAFAVLFGFWVRKIFKILIFIGKSSNLLGKKAVNKSLWGNVVSCLKKKTKCAHGRLQKIREKSVSTWALYILFFGKNNSKIVI